jgi:hypothetical protein
MSSAIPSLDGRLYRAALGLCPAGFRREHADEMARDFDEAHGEAVAAGDRALWILRLLMAIDLVRTFGVQWLRTGFPAIGLASVLVTLALAEAAVLVTLALANGFVAVARHATIDTPADAEILAVLLVAVICVLLIAMTIVLTQWASRPARRGRR